MAYTKRRFNNIGCEWADMFGASSLFDDDQIGRQFNLTSDTRNVNGDFSGAFQLNGELLSVQCQYTKDAKYGR
jgi:hypothetical protein